MRDKTTADETERVGMMMRMEKSHIKLPKRTVYGQKRKERKGVRHNSLLREKEIESDESVAEGFHWGK